MKNTPQPQQLHQIHHTTSLIHQRMSTTGTDILWSHSSTYALQQSRNVPAVRALEKVGLKQAQKFLNGLWDRISRNGVRQRYLE